MPACDVACVVFDYYFCQQQSHQFLRLTRDHQILEFVLFVLLQLQLLSSLLKLLILALLFAGLLKSLPSYHCYDDTNGPLLSVDQDNE